MLSGLLTTLPAPRPTSDRLVREGLSERVAFEPDLVMCLIIEVC